MSKLIYLTRRIQGDKDEALSANKDLATAQHALSIQAESVGTTVGPSGNSFSLPEGNVQFLIAPYKLKHRETPDQAVDRWNAYEPTYPSHAKRDGSRTVQGDYTISRAA